MPRRGWGQKAWIIDYWLKCMKEPFDEPYSIRQVFYKEMPEIVRLVPEHVKENSKDWAKNFYNYMVRYLSDLVLDGEASYRQINVYDDSGASKMVWQDIEFKEPSPPIEDGYVNYPVEIWVENNASLNSLKPLFAWNPDKGAIFQINFVSQRGFANTQEIERLKLYRSEDVKVILNLTDFDPSGYCMPTDLKRRFHRIGLNVDIMHIGVLPEQIPKERREVSLVTYKRNDPRCKMFREAFSADPMVMSYHGYEIQALTPPEIRQLVVKSILATVEQYGFEKVDKFA